MKERRTLYEQGYRYQGDGIPHNNVNDICHWYHGEHNGMFNPWNGEVDQEISQGIDAELVQIPNN